LLRALAAEPARVFGKEELLRDVWGFNPMGITLRKRPRGPRNVAARPTRWPAEWTLDAPSHLPDTRTHCATGADEPEGVQSQVQTRTCARKRRQTETTRKNAAKHDLRASESPGRRLTDTSLDGTTVERHCSPQRGRYASASQRS
jgi:hypothetical protein